MFETPRLALPLLQAAQAQKHVTVNEAMVRLDGLTQLDLLSASSLSPPSVAADGDCYAIPDGSTGAWTGREGKVAIYTNGGWVFVAPRVGWRAWIIDVSSSALFDGADWMLGAVAISQNGAAMVHEVVEFDHVISAGATSVAVGAIPGSSVVFGVTGRVTQTFGGTLSGWQLGVAASADRYGNGLSFQTGSWVRGLSETPITYHDVENLILTPEGANFVDGSIRLAINLLRLNLPRL